MHDLLTPFAQHGVSMTRMESRPSRTGMWEYVFLSISRVIGKAAGCRGFGNAARATSFLKILGSYPAAE
jgi:chorismate mutase/prephenate dehydratase